MRALSETRAGPAGIYLGKVHKGGILPAFKPLHCSGNEASFLTDAQVATLDHVGALLVLLSLSRMLFLLHSHMAMS